MAAGLAGDHVTGVTVFRADASLQMGSGHGMRCLTLVDALPAGPEHFQPGADSAPPVPAHAHWLGCDWSLDAEQSQPALEQILPDGLVVDHHALDARWETALKRYYGKLILISMGGVGQYNPADVRFTVVRGLHALWLNDIRLKVKQNNFRTGFCTRIPATIPGSGY